MSVILNVVFIGLLIRTTGLSPPTAHPYASFVIRQFAVQVKVKNTSQLISDISSVLQKLRRYFDGTAISTSFIASLFSNFPVMFVL